MGMGDRVDLRSPHGLSSSPRSTEFRISSGTILFIYPPVGSPSRSARSPPPTEPIPDHVRRTNPCTTGLGVRRLEIDASCLHRLHGNGCKHCHGESYVDLNA